MSEPTYTITLSESERTAMAKVLGALVTKFINAPLAIEAPPSGAGPHPTAATPSGTSAARAILSPPAVASVTPPIEQRDRWARDRKGNELANPAEAYPADVHVWKTEQRQKFLKVSWQSSSGNGFCDGNCFDTQLWPWLIKTAKEGHGERIRLYLVRKGAYLNIVGLRA